MSVLPIAVALGLLAGEAAALETTLFLAPGGQPAVAALTGEGRPVRCLIDTGAMQAVLAPELLADRGARRLGEVHATGAGGSLRLASWQIDGWRLGGQALPRFAALASNLGKDTPCVLGLAALPGPRIELDFRGGRLRATPDVGELPRHLPYEQILGFLRLSLPFPGQTHAVLILDTGAGTSVLNREAGRRLGLDPARPANWALRRGLDGRTRRHRVHTLDGLRLLPDGATLTRVEIAELPVLDALGVRAEAPGGLLGADALQGRRVVIDRQRQRLEFEPASPE